MNNLGVFTYPLGSSMVGVFWSSGKPREPGQFAQNVHTFEDVFRYSFRKAGPFWFHVYPVFEAMGPNRDLSKLPEYPSRQECHPSAPRLRPLNLPSWCAATPLRTWSLSKIF